jgi:hypothetical protein
LALEVKMIGITEYQPLSKLSMGKERGFGGNRDTMGEEEK